MIGQLTPMMNRLRPNGSAVVSMCRDSYWMFEAGLNVSGGLKATALESGWRSLQLAILCGGTLCPPQWRETFLASFHDAASFRILLG
jgi:hypothetical protein